MKFWRASLGKFGLTGNSVASKTTKLVYRTCKRHQSLLIFVFVALLLVGVILYARLRWQGLVEWSEMKNGEMLRDGALICAAGMAFILAFWRSALMSSQTAQGAQGLRNERYQKGADMLGSSTLATRLGGIYALEMLAKEYPEEYYIQVQNLLCAFVRRPTADSEFDPVANERANAQSEPSAGERAAKRDRLCRDDVQAALQAILAGQDKFSDERFDFNIDLMFADIRFARLTGSDLAGAQLGYVNLTDAFLQQSNLSGATLIRATLSKALLGNADLSDAWLHKADLSGAALSGANLTRTKLDGIIGLTQRQLDAASKELTVEPPLLAGACCAMSGAPLVWKVN